MQRRVVEEAPGVDAPPDPGLARPVVLSVPRVLFEATLLAPQRPLAEDLCRFDRFYVDTLFGRKAMVRNRRFALSAVAVAFGSLAGLAPASAAVINDLFVFGDSYSDTGAFKELSNGPTWAGYLAQDFGITLTTSKNPDPGTDGVNFAESGARVFVGPAPPATQPRSLTQQVSEFQNDVTSDKVTFNPDSTLFFIEGGGNDHTGVTPAVTAARCNHPASDDALSIGSPPYRDRPSAVGSSYLRRFR
jgi:hypothetical protein